MSHAWCSAMPAGVRLAVQITANAKKTEVIGVLGDALKLKLAAQPIDGKANQALIAFLSKTLGVPKSAVNITYGLTNKRKLIEVCAAGLTLDELAQRLLPAQ